MQQRRRAAPASRDFGPVDDDWRQWLVFDRITIIFGTVLATLLLHRFINVDLGYERDTRGWWMVWGFRRFAVYTLVPMLSLRFLLKQSIRDLCFERPSTSDVARYSLMLAVMIPVVLVASTLEGFQAKYPYYVTDGGFGDIWPWWLAYGLQFFGLEFFFRGFIVHTLKTEVGGRVAILIMVIPYLMIHFGKPVVEAVGSIGAGIILGYLSLRKRSIWLGVAIHIGVAITMDSASLAQRGLW